MEDSSPAVPAHDEPVARIEADCEWWSVARRAAYEEDGGLPEATREQEVSHPAQPFVGGEQTNLKETRGRTASTSDWST